MVVTTGLGEVFVKLIIMSLVFGTFNWRKDSKIQSHRPQAHADASPLQEDLSSQNLEKWVEHGQAECSQYWSGHPYPVVFVLLHWTEVSWTIAVLCQCIALLSGEVSDSESNSSSSSSDSDSSEDEVFRDGYDDDLMGDAEDRARLEQMTEKEREQELFNRIEKREVLKRRWAATMSERSVRALEKNGWICFNISRTHENLNHQWNVLTRGHFERMLDLFEKSTCVALSQISLISTCSQ